MEELIRTLSRIANALEGIETALAGKAKAEPKGLTSEALLKAIHDIEPKFQAYISELAIGRS